jgi:hypothetical protein
MRSRIMLAVLAVAATFAFGVVATATVHPSAGPSHAPLAVRGHFNHS